MFSMQPMSRREALQRTAVGFGSLALASMLAEDTRGAVKSQDPLAVKAPHFPAKAKRIIFLILPPERIESQRGLMRLWISTLMRVVVAGGVSDSRRVHFVLDEASSLRHMEIIEAAVDKFRGYGIRLLFIFQDCAQVRKCFPNGQDQNLFGNCTQIYFGVNDYPTADYVSSRLGDETIVLQSGGTGSGMSYQAPEGNGQGGRTYSTSSNDNWAYNGRRLLQPAEVMALPKEYAVTFTQGVPPVMTRLIRHYSEPALLKRSGFGAAFLALVFSAAFAAFGVATAQYGFGLATQYQQQIQKEYENGKRNRKRGQRRFPYQRRAATQRGVRQFLGGHRQGG